MYPEHAKLKAVKDKTQSICEFIDWLAEEKKVHLAEWASNSGYLLRTLKNKEDLVAEFFEIDRRKLEEEKDQMLNEQRALNAEKGIK